MLIHIVCWKYREDIDDDQRRAHRERLRALEALIPEIKRLDVGEDVLHLDRSFDTALVAEFESREDLDVYTDHPEHQAVVAIGREIAEKAVSVDFYRD
jgi:hypothetical protein